MCCGGPGNRWLMQSFSPAFLHHLVQLETSQTRNNHCIVSVLFTRYLTCFTLYLSAACQRTGEEAERIREQKTAGKCDPIRLRCAGMSPPSAGVCRSPCVWWHWIRHILSCHLSTDSVCLSDAWNVCCQIPPTSSGLFCCIRQNFHLNHLRFLDETSLSWSNVLCFVSGRVDRLLFRRVVVVVAAPKEQQVPDGEQEAACAAREERDARHTWRQRQRRVVVLHRALLQTALTRRQRKFFALCLSYANSVRERTFSPVWCFETGEGKWNLWSSWSGDLLLLCLISPQIALSHLST